jgi:hypothetical protein
MKTKERLLRLAKNKGWIWISARQKLSENFIREFQNKVKWEYISINQELSEDFIREFQDKVNWDWISGNQKFSEDFYFDFANKIYFNLIDKELNKWAGENMSEELELFLKLRGEL